MLTAMELGPVVILVLLVVLLSTVSDVFLSFENVGNVLKQSAVICVLALGQLLVIVTRGHRPVGRVEPLAQRRGRRHRLARPRIRHARDRGGPGHRLCRRAR